MLNSEIKDLESSIFHPTYFSSVYQFVKLKQAKHILFEINDNYQKQTYRNRCYILGANGKQLLNVPIQKVSGKQQTKDIKIDYNENWQQQHLKSLFSAYRSSPFFEFYIDDLESIFHKKETYLLDLNLKTLELIFDLLPLNLKYETTKEYQTEVVNDCRYLVNAKSEKSHNLPKYRQVFSDKYDFMENLSILDLLFNEGPNALLYIEKSI